MAANAGNAPACWATVVPGENPPEGKSLPVDHEIEGTLLAPILHGQQLIALRHNRNGVQALGLYRSTPVEEIVLVTRDSVYRLKAMDKSDPCTNH
ncbi:MAG: hypothetical protein Q7S40_18730 [Opitutaceae bacterium]|nr:hypothetical protein [Opitutaceae bacterium]